ncbi:CHK domain-containing protein [Trichostrongylus colubriformis]|uniref:CHK domain-containing protein n=1 Tax=Trichostrongylus colubriformis TaxID=6319 RepID=A0AAN8IN20_TRICO
MFAENLRTAGNGLYDTYITWEDIEEDMKRELNTTSSFGPKKSAANTGDGNNAHFGCPATDLVRLFCSCLSGKDRRAHWEELLEEFYGYLQKEVGGRKMPYTLEQLKEAYRRYFPVGAFMTMSVFGPLFDAISINCDQSVKTRELKCLTEKTECLLDDIFYYHDRNQRI